MHDKVGLAAGQVWNYLHQGGESTISKMAKDLRQKDNIVYMGLGWLARENKVAIRQDKRAIKVKLAELEASRKASENKAKKEKIMGIIAEKQDESLAGKSIAALTKMIAELE